MKSTDSQPQIQSVRLPTSLCLACSLLLSSLEKKVKQIWASVTNTSSASGIVHSVKLKTEKKKKKINFTWFSFCCLWDLRYWLSGDLWKCYIVSLFQVKEESNTRSCNTNVALTMTSAKIFIFCFFQKLKFWWASGFRELSWDTTKQGT